MSEAIAPGAQAPAAESAVSAENNSTQVPQSQGQNGQADQAVQEIQDAVEAGEISEAQAAKMVKKLELKVRGKTITKEIDLSDEQYLKEQLQLAEVAKMEMQSGAELRKAYQREMERLRSDPFSVLQELGLDPEELSTGYISKKIEEMKKSPEQIEKERYQKELETAKERLKKLEQEREEAEMSRYTEQAKSQLNEEVDKAIQAHKSLPNHPLVRKRIFDEMKWAMDQGFNEVTAEDVLPIVHKQMRSELSDLYDSMPDDALEDWIGKKTIERQRKSRLSAKKVANLNDVKPTAASVKQPKEEESAPKKKISAKEFFRGR